MAEMNGGVAVVRCESYAFDRVYAALKEAVLAVDGLSCIKPGMRVAIKANLMMPKKPDEAVTVHPAVVQALAKLISERGATAVVGDSPGGPYSGAYLNTVYRVCGLSSAGGYELNEDFSEREVEFDGVTLRHFPVTNYLIEADAVICLCKIKTHALMAYTGAVKNFYGAVPGMLKAEYHYRYPTAAQFSNMLVDLVEFCKPVLSIGDAIVGMEGNGPSAGTPRAMNALFASKNPHALDLAAASVMGLTPGEVPTLKAAIERGLVPDLVEKLPVYGDLNSFRIPDFQKAVTQDVQDFGSRNPRISKLIRDLLACRPGLYPGKCVGCGECAKICPAKAIAIRDGKAAFDRKKCIRCFCCQEFCPRGAIHAKRPLMARLMSKRNLG